MTQYLRVFRKQETNTLITFAITNRAAAIFHGNILPKQGINFRYHKFTPHK